MWLRGRDLNPRPLGYEPNELIQFHANRDDWQTALPRGALVEGSMVPTMAAAAAHNEIVRTPL
jgi:hypothetical protein